MESNERTEASALSLRGVPQDDEATSRALEAKSFFEPGMSLGAAVALEGWDVRQSQAMREWKDQARREALREGRLEEKRRSLLTVLREWFQAAGASAGFR